jgi:hypothetical protein
VDARHKAGHDEWKKFSHASIQSPSLRAPAKQSIVRHKERMDCFVAEPVIGSAEKPDPLAPRNDGGAHTHLHDPATQNARAVESKPSPRMRAQGMPGARCTRGLVCNMEKKTHTSIQVQRRQSDIPCAMV